MVRNSLRFVPWKDYKAITADLKLIYDANAYSGEVEHRFRRKMNTSFSNTLTVGYVYLSCSSSVNFLRVALAHGVAAVEAQLQLVSVVHQPV